MKDVVTEQRWAIRFDSYGIGIEPVENGCRDYDCCGGKDCGFTTDEAQSEVVNHFQVFRDYYHKLTPEEFVKVMGYHND